MIEQVADVRLAAREKIVQLAESNKKIYCIDSDVGGLDTIFATRHYDRYVDVGIAEAALISVSAGIAHAGGIPFANSFSAFAAGRAFEQLKVDVCYPNLGVKIIASHSGLSAGHLGPTHHATEDIGILRCLPNMTIFVPADARDAAQLVEKGLSTSGPVFIRIGRRPTPQFSWTGNGGDPMNGRVLLPGDDVALICAGPHPTRIALQARSALARYGLYARVINFACLKPFDHQSVIAAASQTNGIVTIEDHNVIGGLGSLVAEAVTEARPCPVRRIGIADKFVETVGNEEELLEMNGVNVSTVVTAAKLICSKNRQVETYDRHMDKVKC